MRNASEWMPCCFNYSTPMFAIVLDRRKRSLIVLHRSSQTCLTNLINQRTHHQIPGTTSSVETRILIRCGAESCRQPTIGHVRNCHGETDVANGPREASWRIVAERLANPLLGEWGFIGVVLVYTSKTVPKSPSIRRNDLRLAAA